MDYQAPLVTLGPGVILVRMVQQDKQVYLDLLDQQVIEDLLVLLVQEDFRVCLALQGNLENPVKMESPVFQDSLE